MLSQHWGECRLFSAFSLPGSHPAMSLLAFSMEMLTLLRHKTTPVFSNGRSKLLTYKCSVNIFFFFCTILRSRDGYGVCFTVGGQRETAWEEEG